MADRIIKRARRLRQESNSAEDHAWQVLRQLRAYGYPVRRQHPIDGMIVDFAIVKARLVIEIDGGIHAREEVQRRDSERDGHLAALGWSVLRVPAEESRDADHLMRLVQEKLGI